MKESSCLNVQCRTISGDGKTHVSKGTGKGDRKLLGNGQKLTQLLILFNVDQHLKAAVERHLGCCICVLLGEVGRRGGILTMAWDSKMAERKNVQTWAASWYPVCR